MTGSRSHMRSTSGSRMSLAPGRPNQPVFQRSSSGDNLVGMASVQRNSSGQARRSMAVPGFALSTPAPNNLSQSSGNMDASTARRSSVYSGRQSGQGHMGNGHQSFFATAPPPAGVPNDPRNLRSANAREQMANELMEYFSHNNFEMEAKHSLNAKSMTSPTQRDFEAMFMWLYHRIDPAYRFQFPKQLDKEVPGLLKQMRYPFEKSIMKSQIGAVGGNNWHTFLGLLHWMMQLSRMAEAYAQGQYDQECAEAGYDIGADRIIFDFLTDSYREWLNMEADDDEMAAELIKPHVEKMAAQFEHANKQHLDEVKMLEAENKALSDQLDEFNKLDERRKKQDEIVAVLEDDRRKFEQYNDTMQGKMAKYQDRVRLLEDEIRKVEAELEEVEAERRQMQDSVDAQGITINDIDRMNTDRERLQRGVETTAQRLEDTRTKVSEKESEASLRLDELERAVEAYNSLGYSIAVIPATASNAKGQNFELTLHVNEGPSFSASQMGNSQGGNDAASDRLLSGPTSGYLPSALLNLDLKGAIKAAIMTLRKEISERRNSALEQDMNNHDLLDKIKEAIDDKLSEVDGLGHRVHAAEEEFEKTREIVGAQKMASEAQIEKMEKELARMRAGLSESVQVMEQREMNTTIE